jgi:hypothetical protein
VEPLPVIPSCALDEPGLRRQLDRYREIGQGAHAVRRDEVSLEIEIDARVDPASVEAAVATERECSPFLHPTWDADRKRLGFSVARRSERARLDAIAVALNITDGRRRTSTADTDRELPKPRR